MSDTEYPQDHMADEIADARIMVARIDAAICNGRGDGDAVDTDGG